MVAEENDVVRIYDAKSGRFAMSFHASGPVLDADWNRRNPEWLGAVAGGKYILVRWRIVGQHVDVSIQWTTRSGAPVTEEAAHDASGVRFFRWSNADPNVFATAANEVKIWSRFQSNPPRYFGMQKSTIGGISWHAMLPVCAAGTGEALSLWADNIELKRKMY